MKKIIAMFLSLVVITVMAISVCVAAKNADGATTAGTSASPKAVVCLSHNYTVFQRIIIKSDGNRYHVYRCSTQGCGETSEGMCSVSFCGDYFGEETGPCVTCGCDTPVIHNFEAVHTGSDASCHHRVQCTNTSSNGMECGLVQSYNVSCTLGPKYIWRGFAPNYGHYITRLCSECGYNHTVDYEYPAGHPNYYSPNNDCEICKMTGTSMPWN